MPNPRRSSGAEAAGARAAALTDTAALLVFTAIGIAMHGAGFGIVPILRNVVPFVGVWFVLAPVTRIYRRPGWRVFLIHWAMALPLAVVARQWWVGRLFTRATVAFFIASLVLTLAILAAGRLLLWLGRRAQALRTGA